MNWGLTGVSAAVVLAVAFEFASKLDFEPDSLPPTGAGKPHRQMTNTHICEDVIYQASRDGIKYVRESGGGTYFVASLNNDIAIYELDKYGHMVRTKTSDLNPDDVARLEYALFKCNGPFLPSGTTFGTNWQAHAGG